MSVSFQLGIDRNGVVTTDTKNGFRLTWKPGLSNGNDGCSICIELSWFPHSTLDSSIIGLVEFFLDGEWNRSWFTENWFDIWLELDLQLEVFETAQFRLKEVRELLAKLLACLLEGDIGL